MMEHRSIQWVVLLAAFLLVWLAMGIFVPSPDGNPRGSGEPAKQSRTTRIESEENFLALRFDLHSPTSYKLTADISATWNASKAYLVRMVVMTDVDDAGVLRAGRFKERDTTCSDDRVPGNGTCPVRKISIRRSPTMRGSLRPGSYVVYIAGFGADDAKMSMTLETNQTHRRVGHQSLDSEIIILDQMDGESGEEFNRSESFAVRAVAAFGVFDTAGAYDREPTYEVEHRRRISFTRRCPPTTGSGGDFQPSCPGYNTSEGYSVFTPAWIMPTGVVHVRVEGGEKAGPGDTGLPIVGHVPAPLFLIDDDHSTFTRLGPGV